ncbi:Translation Initiation Factor 5B [Sparganum proliferum]
MTNAIQYLDLESLPISRFFVEAGRCPGTASQCDIVRTAVAGTYRDVDVGDVPATASQDDKKNAKSKKKPAKKEAKKDAKPTKEAIRAEKVSKHVAKLKEEIARRKAEEERIRQEEEEEERRIQEELRKEEERKRIEAEKHERRKQKEKERRQRLKEEGKLLTEKQKEDRRKAFELAQARGLDLSAPKSETKRPNYSKKKKKSQVPNATTDTEVVATTVVEPQDVESPKDDVLDDWIDLTRELTDVEQKVTEDGEANDLLSEDSEGANSESLIEVGDSNLPDAGSTSKHREQLLSEEEKQRLIEQAKARIENREAGGITQQIGATNVPRENIISATNMCKYFNAHELELPGLLIIDTPGHESFSNLRVRGSSLCDFAILVVDLMHSLEEQTKESIKILRSRKAPFVVALNKIDRLYEWKSDPTKSVQETMAAQNDVTMNDFNTRLKQVVQDFAMLEINVELFYKNQNPDEYISMVPTSAHTGDGMGDLLAFICQTMQQRLRKRLTFSEELKASVMEVKETVGLGTSLDVIVVNGRIREGDTIVLAGQEGPIVTTVRGILFPAPMSELRVKGTYEHLKEVTGAQGVKLIAKDLEKALAGLPLYVAEDTAEELYYKDEVSRGLREALKAISVSPVGVYVVASTLGSLESLLVYLKSVNIPCSGISVGTVHKKDVMKASIMVERDLKWAVILAFDVKVDKDAQRFANEVGVRIFTSEIIYHLQQKMEEYVEELMKDNRRKHRDQAVFPVKLSILPDMVFNKRAPIVMGVRVEAGLLREGTPICVPTRDNICLGRVFSIESNHKTVPEARTGQEVCVRIDPLEGEAPKLFGRHFDQTDTLISKISRESIDIVKEFFRNDLNKEDWKLMVELKKYLSIL